MAKEIISSHKKTLGQRYEPANHGRLQQEVFLAKPRQRAMPVKEWLLKNANNIQWLTRTMTVTATPDYSSPECEQVPNMSSRKGIYIL